jgi:protein O-GlcNAc transferase
MRSRSGGRPMQSEGYRVQDDNGGSPQAPPPAGAAWKVDSLVAMGRAHYETGNLDKACAMLLEALSYDADNVDALFLTGIIAHQAGLHEVSVRNLGRAVQLRPALVTGHTVLALGLLALGRDADALAPFHAARDL